MLKYSRKMRRKGRERRNVWGFVRRESADARREGRRASRPEAFSIMELGERG